MVDSGATIVNMNGSHRHRRSVYLDDDQWAALAELAKAEDRSVNGIVRRFVVEGLRRPTAMIDLGSEPTPIKAQTAREAVAVRDEEIARLKRELAKRPPEGLAGLVGTHSGFVDASDGRAVVWAEGTETPVVDQRRRRARQRVIDETLRKIGTKKR